MNANFFVFRFRTKQKARSPSSAPSFSTVAAGAGLGDDLGSLRKNRDGDRSKQNKGGGDRSNLGHFRFPQVFRGSLTMRCRRLCAWMRRDECFLHFIFASLFKQKRGPCGQDPRFHPTAPLEGTWRGAFQRARCPSLRCALRVRWMRSHSPSTSSG